MAQLFQLVFTILHQWIFFKENYFFRLLLSDFHLNWHDLSMLFNTFSFPTNFIFPGIQAFTK